MGARMPAQSGSDDLPHAGTRVHRHPCRDVRVEIEQGQDAVAHGDERRPVVFATVRSDEDVLGPWPPRLRNRSPRAAGQRLEQRIDDGVAGDDDGAVVDALAQQIRAGLPGRCEMEIGEARGHRSIRFFGEWAVLVTRAQARLDVADPDAVVEGSQRAGEGGRRVALHEHPVGPLRGEHFGQAANARGHDMRQGLLRLHDVQVDIGADVELFHQLVDELAMLAGADHANGKAVAARACGQDHRRQLDRFGSGADDCRDGDGPHALRPTRPSV